MLFRANKSADAWTAAATVSVFYRLLGSTRARAIVLLALALCGCGGVLRAFMNVHELAMMSHHVAATPRTGAMLSSRGLKFLRVVISAGSDRRHPSAMLHAANGSTHRPVVRVFIQGCRANGDNRSLYYQLVNALITPATIILLLLLTTQVAQIVRWLLLLATHLGLAAARCA